MYIVYVISMVVCLYPHMSDWHVLTQREKYNVANIDPKYVVVKGNRWTENKCLKWLIGPHNNEKL
jgi:hypothetical protein